MPTRLRHRHRVGHGPCSTRLLTLGLALIAALPPRRLRPLSQGAADRRARRRLHHGRPLQLGHAVHDTNPDTIGNIFRNSLDPPNVTISNDTTGTWHRQDDILERPVATSSEISQAYNFDAGDCLAIIFYKANQTIHDEGRRGGDNLSSSTEVQETMPNHSSFSVTSGPTSVNAVRDDNGTLPGYEIEYTATVTYSNGSTNNVAGYRFFRQISDLGVTLEVFLECTPDKLASADTWHQFLFSTRVAGLDAGAMG